MNNVISIEAKPFTLGIYNDAIALFRTGELNDAEMTAIHIALSDLLITRMMTDEINPNIKINMVFVFEDELHLNLDFSTTLGVYTRFAILPVHKWREEEYGIPHMVLSIVEEAVHLLMNITDEDYIMTKALEVMHRSRPEHITGFYPYNHMPKTLPYYLKDTDAIEADIEAEEE